MDNLVELRAKAGLTQQQMAELLRKSQSAVSKLESSTDQELTLRELSEYAMATKSRFNLGFGKPMNHVESVNWHVQGIQEHLKALASMANEDEDMGPAIQSFFNDALLNILRIVGRCQQDMPNGNALQIRFRQVSLPSKVRETTHEIETGELDRCG